MKFFKGCVSWIILCMYAFGASTFSHMISMDHPAEHTMAGHHMEEPSAHADTAQCIQICKLIEQSKLSLTIALPTAKSITLPVHMFPVLSYEDIWDVAEERLPRLKTPPGDYIFIDPHLRSIESTILLI